MKQFEIDKGLDLALAGAPAQQIDPVVKEIHYAAVTGPDYVGMKPTLAVEPGQRVLAGEILFEDKKNPGVKFTAPGAGTVEEINRGEKRSFRSVVIKLDEGTKADKSVEFESFRTEDLDNLCRCKTRDILVQSGLWTALRTRPFSRIPKIDATPASLFVNAMDTNPGAPDPAVVIGERVDDFVNGLKVLSRICGKKIWLCKSPAGIDIPGDDLPLVESAIFAGPHPAGLSGTHIHYLDPVGAGKSVWTIGYQDVLAIGKLFTTGRYPRERVVALSGPMVSLPRLLRTYVGACLYELTKGELKEGPARIISGSVLFGRKLDKGLSALGPYVNQVSVIGDGDPREMFAWTLPCFRKFSLARTVASRWLPKWPYKMTTALHGGTRAIFPNDQFEQIMPLDILPIFLFKALEVGDIESAEQLGALELDEEDVALCTLVDFGKNDYTQTLRAMLDAIAKEEA